MDDTMTVAETAEQDDPIDSSPAPDPFAECLSEVYYLRDWYAEEVAELRADESGHELLMRRHFGSWADRIASSMIGGGGAALASYKDFREYLSNPALYPGGEDALLADAIHATAISRLSPRARQSVDDARRALAELEFSARSLEHREVCPFCKRRREGLGKPSTGRSLDDFELCEACVDTASREHIAWRRKPVTPTTEAW